jgi:segregation and condensation protein B
MGYVKEMLEKLQKDYEGRGMEIVNTPQGWVMQVRSEFLGKVAHLTPYADISEGCKRSLAIIAYKEPVSQAEIIRIQGNKAYSYLKQLQKRNLIRAEKKGRTKIIKLTQEFERYFGEEKESIKEKLESFQKEEKEEPAKKKAKQKKEKPEMEGRRTEERRRQESPSSSETPSNENPPSSKQSKPEAKPAKEEAPKKETGKKSDIDHILE